MLFVRGIEQRPDGWADRTNQNRATYDRIAVAYAEHQQRDVSGGDSLFATLEASFLSLVPESGLVGDIGCGPGFDGARFAARGLRVVGVDLSARMLDLASPRLADRLAQADMRALPLVSGEFDGLWCVAALLHVPEADTMMVLQEFRRILRHSGTLALVTALGVAEAVEDVPYAHGERRWFVYRDQEILSRQVSAAGFAITLAEQVDGNRRWSTLLAQAT